MFLDIVQEKNPQLIKAAIKLHQRGEILPDTYILDVDAILENGKALCKKAEENGIKLYAMTKQFGRVPYLAKKLVEIGFAGIVTVDFKEALVMMDNGVKLGNVGHLVQIPTALVDKVIRHNPEIITVYSLEKIKEIDEAAKRYGKVQDIMLRVLERDSKIYSGQSGGFYLDEIEAVAKEVLKLENVKLNGLTSFPCFLYNCDKNIIEGTKNIETIKKAEKILKEMGIFVKQLNMPSATSLENMESIKKYGGTHGEPGHALTGTTPFNSKNLHGEIPAILYVSEISHNLDYKSYCYGGGHYRRSGMSSVLVGKDIKDMKRCSVEAPTMESIDYYFEISGNNPVGQTVVGAFRTQIFVTRSNVALVEGIKNEEPQIIGIYDSLGREI
ncbi:YhfX family PLP-dependent enzyme [Cetobacterium somerae]|uniref:YhfX family PLP-dependent enzyme n=1 Tax=Cetobacterium sp. NK01 TaxID=2993530 RepID=UPI0021162B17|nr:YhfX family PLP-dependent enzyme [Cetobacterium sp. NK01]MCQ8212732.1 YhfX family PLP-dependent enzyme [Cetobacterium sp. NK01]